MTVALVAEARQAEWVRFVRDGALGGPEFEEEFAQWVQSLEAEAEVEVCCWSGAEIEFVRKHVDGKWPARG